MMHYTCDLCKRTLDPDDDIRYVVRIEVNATFEPSADNEPDDDRDHLLEIQEILENLDDTVCGQVSDEVAQTLRFDLCSDCRRRFVKNPLGRESKVFDFSQN